MRITFSSEKEVDYEKIRQIVRETVKEELDKKEQPAPLTKEDIQEAVCGGIILADEKKIEMEKERIKNTKVSLGTKLLIVFHIACAVIFAVCLLLTACFAVDMTWMNRLSVCMKYGLIATLCYFIAYAEYAVGKNSDPNFAYNILTVLLSILTLALTILQFGG